MAILISIIIPLFNRDSLIVDTLKSISNQSYIHWECIIVDDHSTDNSFNVVNDYIANDSRFKLLKRPNDRIKGANACRNYGYEESTGNYINWFDSDDIMHQNFLDTSLKTILHKKTDAVISKTMIFSESTNNIIGKELRTNLSDNILDDFLSLKIAWYLQSVLWERSFLNNKDLFDESLMAGQDRDFHSRILLYEPNLMVIEDYLIYYRKHEKSITGTIDDIRNRELKISHLNSVNRLIDKIDEADKLSNSIKLFLFNAMIKYLPFTINNSVDMSTLKKVLKKTSFPNMNIAIGWTKFYLAYISLKITGKGSKLLR